MSHYPTIEKLLESPDKIVLKVQRSFRSIISHMLYFFISFIGFIALSVAFHGSEYPIRWLAIVPIGFFLDLLRRYYNDVVHFERHKLTQYYGRLSLNYGVPSLKYADIRSIYVDQDIFGRILDYGDVELGTAGVDGMEMVIHGIRSPTEIANLINDLRTSSARLLAAESGGTTNDYIASND